MRAPAPTPHTPTPTPTSTPRLREKTDRHQHQTHAVPPPRRYYHRRNGEGQIEASTCMNNTASEHAMCERLIVDDLVHWAKDYKARE